MWDRSGSFLLYQNTYMVEICQHTMLVSNNSIPSVHPTPTPISIRLLDLTGITYPSPKSCLWHLLFQAVISHLSTEQIFILQGGPAPTYSRSASHSLSTSIFHYTHFTTSKIGSNLIFVLFIFLDTTEAY